MGLSSVGIAFVAVSMGMRYDINNKRGWFRGYLDETTYISNANRLDLYLSFLASQSRLRTPHSFFHIWHE